MTSDWLALIPDAVMGLDGAGVIVFASSPAEELTGYMRPELLGAHCVSLLKARGADGEPLRRHGWHSSALLRSTRGLREQAVTIRTKGGVDVAISVSGRYRRDPEGNLTGAVLSLRRLARGQVSDIRGIEVVSMLSHELRSPLTSVKGYTGLLLSRWDRLSDDQKQMMLEQINHDADRVARLISELLDISRLEAGRLVLRRQFVDLPRLSASVTDKMTLAYPDFSSESSFPADFPCVYADPDKIEQVLTNLLENACKYASPQGIRITGRTGQAQVSVEVSDRGEGIPAQDLAKVGAKFFRRSSAHPTGSGLGLWISRGLVDAHGGELTAESIVGSGSTFRFTLPLVDFDRLHEA